MLLQTQCAKTAILHRRGGRTYRRTDGAYKDTRIHTDIEVDKNSTIGEIESPWKVKPR